MKKVQIILILMALSISFLTPLIIKAQTSPSTCVKLNNDIKWTGTIGTKDCSAAPNCTFKKGFVVGETINAGDCGAAAATLLDCQTNANPPWNAGVQNANCITGMWGMLSILNSLYTITSWIFIVLMILVGLLIIYGGITIATAGGSPEKATQGRTVILYALIGLAVALLSKALPSVVKALLGM